MEQDNMERLTEEIERQMKQHLFQGCVCGTIDKGPFSFGLQARHPKDIKMTPQSRFDIASVGKVFTASCCAIMHLQGKLDLDAPFTEYLPEHVLGKNCRISVRALATHSSGFSNDEYHHETVTKPFEAFYNKKMQTMPIRECGKSFEYCCFNFTLLGFILNRIMGKDLDTIARELLWEPLGMTHTTWNEPGPGPFEVEHHSPDRPAGQHNDTICREVNVPLGAGSAFSTYGDMLLFAKDMAEQTHFPKEYYKLLSTPTFQIDNPSAAGLIRRSFGWDMSDYRRPLSFSEHSIYHTGFTGQTIAIDCERGKAAVVLTSRTGDWELANQGRNRIIDCLP